LALKPNASEADSAPIETIDIHELSLNVDVVPFE